ncbi:LytR/AlgR family response regulator transcription factor [Aquimarina sp. 2201CG14-23]|uniref:LytR/AlgR family response regulator transcription factor n=1 Tax=Aquimarina mycalae TaxID=3040073 RepID=UPI0024781808|nr:LytTR family DNA-binding domain-containing protein [Aquimarina sp. 2201CG14-23]MDH7446901.1 LytTR family DNA-binding domain-containing protein [Aquimarina sp. 2201CG14-23]
MKALVIDDENKARRLLQALIEGECKDITTIIQASDLESGVQLIKAEEPDIVFLDIEMPQHSGLQILDFFEDEEVTFQIIFTTGYNQYAVEAFKLSAIDYLLKPIDIEELKVAVDKAVISAKERTINDKFEDLKKSFKQLSLNKLALDIPKGIIFVSHDDVLYFEADGMYTKVYLQGNKTELICKPLKHFILQLESKSIFYKPHRSYLINLKHIKELSKKDGYHLIMENNKTIPIAKDKKEEFIRVIKEVF